jgi:protein CpxP
MRFSSLRLALVAGLILPASLATACLAEPAPPPSSPGASMRMGHDHMRDPAEMRAHMAEHLSAVLQLLPSQQGALTAYLDALSPSAGMMGRMEQGDGDADHLSAPERMDHMLAHIDAMRAHVAASAEATKRFYAQLTPSQQRAFDALAPMMLHHMGGHMGDDMGGHDGMMGHHHDGDGPEHEMGPDGQPPG